MKPEVKIVFVMVFVLMTIVYGGIGYNAWAAATRFRPTTELVQAAHKILDMGYDCRASGAERIACHAQLTTAINQRFR